MTLQAAYHITYSQKSSHRSNSYPKLTLIHRSRCSNKSSRKQRTAVKIQTANFMLNSLTPLSLSVQALRNEKNSAYNTRSPIMSCVTSILLTRARRVLSLLRIHITGSGGRQHELHAANLHSCPRQEWGLPRMHSYLTVDLNI